MNGTIVTKIEEKKYEWSDCNKNRCRERERERKVTRAKEQTER